MYSSRQSKHTFPSIVEENQEETMVSWILEQIETQLLVFESHVSQDRENNVEDVDTSWKIVEENTEVSGGKTFGGKPGSRASGIRV